MNKVHMIKISYVIRTMLANGGNSKKVPDLTSALKDLISNGLKG